MVFLLFTFLFPSEAKLLRNNYESARATGMGNAFIALADDSSAPWYNPASLTDVKGKHFNLANVAVGVDSLDTLSRFGGLLAGNGNNYLRSDTEMVRFPFQIGWISKYLSIQGFNQFHSFTDLGGLTLSNMDLALYNDIGGIAAVAFPMSEYFSVGVSARVFIRTGMDQYITPAQLLAGIGVPSPQFQQQIYTYLFSLFGMGLGTGFNVGTLLKIPLSSRGKQRLRLAATIEDFGGINFLKLSTNNVTPVSQTINFGGAVQYLLSPKMQLNLTCDFRHAFDAPHLMKMLHFGAELRHKYFSLRVGAYQLYPTFGISIEPSVHTKIHFSSYAAELGDGPYQRSQRWYMGQVIIGFNPL